MAPAPDVPRSMIHADRSVACELLCITRADGEAMARKATDRLEVRSQAWETLCPHEFRQPLDFNKCNQQNMTRLMAWRYRARGAAGHGRRCPRAGPVPTVEQSWAGR